jgi:hypothetical protein
MEHHFGHCLDRSDNYWTIILSLKVQLKEMVFFERGDIGFCS